MKRTLTALGATLLTVLAVFWSREYAALDRALVALRAPPPELDRVVPAPSPAASALPASAPASPAPASAVAAEPAPVAVAEPPPAPTPREAVEPPAPAPERPAADSGTALPVNPLAADAPARGGRGVGIAENGGSYTDAGPLIKLRALNGTERIGVVLDKGVAIGPIMELAYEPGVMRLESLATEPVALFQVKATKSVPVVNPLGEKAGTPVKICGVGDEGVSCVPARLRQGLRYYPADDQVVLEAGSFNAVFPGGAALFKTGPGGGLLGYQSAPVEGGSARFVPVNYFGRFVMLRNSLGPLLNVAFSDILMQGRRDANYNPLAPNSPPAAVSAPAASSASGTT